MEPGSLRSGFQHAPNRITNTASMFLEPQEGHSEDSDEDPRQVNPTETWDQDLQDSNLDPWQYNEPLPNEKDDSEQSKSKVPDTMQACMALAAKVLPGLVEEPATQAASSQSNLTMLLGLAKKNGKTPCIEVLVARLGVAKPNNKDEHSQGFRPS